MKIVFISNYYNHHQAPFCEAMFNQTHGHFWFVATEQMSQERKKMGWGIDSLPDFVKEYYLSHQSQLECMTLIDDADVVISGQITNKLIRNRLRDHKLCFKYSERLLKKNSFPRFCAYMLRSWFYNRWYHNFYMLCSSAYTSFDYYRMFSFRGKFFKWGYFPLTVKYNDVTKLMKEKKTLSILWVARLIKWKHPELAIEVIKKLKAEGYNVHLNIIGTGILEKEILSLIDNYNLKSEVHLLGSMTPNEVREHMEKTEIFLFTSDRNEGWGAVLNEAMNSGCAVVASHAIGAVPYLIKDGKNGLIYKDGDINDLYDKTKWLIDHNLQRKEIAIRAMDTMNLWSADNAASRLVNLVYSLQRNEDTPYIDGPCSRAEIITDNWK